MRIFLILCIFGSSLFGELEAGALFEYGRCSGKATQNSEKASAENFNLLGQHDKNVENVKKRSAQVRAQYQQRLRTWIRDARNIAAQNQIPAVQLLNNIQGAIRNGNDLLRATPMDEIATEKAKLHNHFDKTENQIKTVIVERKESLKEATKTSISIKKKIELPQDQLDELSKNDPLRVLGAVQVGNLPDWKDFLQAVEQQRYEKNHQGQLFSDREAALARIRHQMNLLDVQSPWYEEGLEDLKWQLSLLEKSL